MKKLPVTLVIVGTSSRKIIYNMRFNPCKNSFYLTHIENPKKREHKRVSRTSTVCKDSAIRGVSLFSNQFC